jgi:PAS domain S-box-containing protein
MEGAYAASERRTEVLWEDGDITFYRALRTNPDGRRTSMLAARATGSPPTAASLERLSHEHGFKDQLDGTWALRPLELVRQDDRTVLLFEDVGGNPLQQMLGKPLDVVRFLRLATRIAMAVGHMHQHGLVHKDLKPAHMIVDEPSGSVWLTGFGIATRFSRERQTPEPPEFVAGTLAYMAPEQTGRTNRSIDARSDLYSLGVTFYQMLTGSLPFSASDPMEWVHCHIARMPISPSERAPRIPVIISAIVIKLLAKTADERYQTASGVENDLRRCLAEWEAFGQISSFPLAERDVPDQLLIPEKLYGREQEVATLLATFGRVVINGRPELVLLSGYSGVGKSSLVNELHGVLVPLRGLFASGKFDRFKPDIPYSTLAQAFQGLANRLLGKPEAELVRWRDALLDALGPNGKLMTDLIPGLTLIVGEQPPVPALPTQQAQSRFQLVFRRFISVFANDDHPLVLFLDDLHWADAATLHLLADLVTAPDVRHLMLIGAYRDNEVDAKHPLHLMLNAIRNDGAAVHEIILPPLSREYLVQLIADALRCSRENAGPLAELVFQKTGGNPFFVIQFLTELAEERLLTFDYDTACWSWQLESIRAMRHTDNIADLMVEKLNRLPYETMQALQELACLGSAAKIAVLSIIHRESEAQIEAGLWGAVASQLIERRADTYRFIHDRLREAAYSLISEQARAHLRIARLLAERTPPEKLEEEIFEIVNQYNHGSSLLSSWEEREQVARLNLTAGRRAKASAAYTSALRYLGAGMTLLDDNCWDRCRDLTFSLEQERAECEFLTGELATADRRLTELARRASNTRERSSVICLLMDVCTTLGQSDRAITIALDHLRQTGIVWSPHPSASEVQREYERILSYVGNRSIEELTDLTIMRDPESLAAVEVLTKLQPAAMFTDSNLACLCICKAVSLTLEYGLCDASCLAFVGLGRIGGLMFGDYETGFRFGQVGYALVEQRGLIRFKASTYLCFVIFVMRWRQHVRASRPVLQVAFDAANHIGDLQYAAYSCNNLNSDLLFAGDHLANAQIEAERGLAFARKARHGLVIDIIDTQLALIQMLRGAAPTFGRLDGKHIVEQNFEQHLSETPELAIAECWYWIRKLQARYLAGDYIAATNAASKAHALLWTSASFLEEAEYHFYGALAWTARHDLAPTNEKRQCLEHAAVLLGKLVTWAANCPQNFENRVALVKAEIARIEGRTLDAEQLFERSIRFARDNGFIHNEGLASELAARFYDARGFEIIAHAYLRNARYCYLSWGADGKVKQLEAEYPDLNTEDTAIAPARTIRTPVERLDLGTVIKVSQAFADEIVQENLVDTLMRMALEQAGAERSLLVLLNGEGPRILAEASTTRDTVLVRLCDEPLSATALPETVLHYAWRTRENVIVDDAIAEPTYAVDPYVIERQARSMMFLPLIAQTKLVGVLYLENNLAPGIFGPNRIAVLRLLASQAAITLEIARLYRELAQREAKIRRLVDANIVGIFFWDYDGRILDANDAFLRIVGRTRGELVAGHLRWTDLTPPKWLEQRGQGFSELKATGALPPYEKEFFKVDGEAVPVLIGAATFEVGGNQGVAFVLDLTESKRAEADVRESERRNREMQTAFAHASRVAAMGQLTASISHEIRQPISAIAASASAGLRWLNAPSPNVDETRQVLDRVVQDAMRAGAIMSRIHGFVKNAPSHIEWLQVNDVIREVIALTRGEAENQRISVQTRLEESLPTVKGDRVQLQQVMMNLTINAIEAMSTVDRERTLAISSDQDESGSLVVTVCDSGPGLCPEIAGRLFEPFFTTKKTGLGIGLSICRSIVEAHHGKLHATANSPFGSVFQFHLPVHAGDTRSSSDADDRSPY